MRDHPCGQGGAQAPSPILSAGSLFCIGQQNSARPLEQNKLPFICKLLCLVTLMLEASLLFILLLFSEAKAQGSLSEGLILGRISCLHRQVSGKLLALTGSFPLLPSLLLLPTKRWFSFCQPSVLFSESEPERGGWRRPCADGSDQGQLGPGPEHGSAQSGTSGLPFLSSEQPPPLVFSTIT